MFARSATVVAVLALARVAVADDGGFSTTVLADEGDDGRATSSVTKAELERRLPRSTPDALRFEPGVFIQQTAHGQASAYLRGLTGQQTVLVFDDVRLNTSTWRQGPNQYAFTLDSWAVSSLEVVRGGASTRLGSDALGGAIIAHARQAPASDGGVWLLPAAFVRGTSADQEAGARVELEGVAGPIAFIGGVGARQVGLLESSGPLVAPADVPRFADDGRTQLGTGFKEVTADGRVTWRPTTSDEVTLAAQVYRQFDSPRTDQCPPAFARADECLRYLEQFRTLSWLSWKRAHEGLLAKTRVAVSWQRQHELREGVRPASFVRSTGRDVVDTFGLNVGLVTRGFEPFAGAHLRVEAGLDSWLDVVDSVAFIEFTDLGVVRAQPRGQYVSGSSSWLGGVFIDSALELPLPQGAVLVRGGARLGWASLVSPGEAAPSTLGGESVRAAWAPFAARLGVEWKPTSLVSLFVNGDRSFRAPNLDDLTSRQQTGPGFQFENAALRPESALGVEVGAALRTTWLSLEAWGFQTWLFDAVVRAPRDVAQCPPASPQCAASWQRFQLINADGASQLRGVEASSRVRLPLGFTARAAVSWAWGQGSDGVPLSRVPPANGHVELAWRHAVGFTGAAVLRWAARQDRLAIADLSDPRIPLGGTPGYAVVDLRASLRLPPFVLSLVFENLADAPWRAHGSSVNGAARGLHFLLGVQPGR
ncbi:MAG: TonB-dependent receptor [Archangium sp.]|nr:TonB-dependent receptor [Archangium sp.]